MSRHYLTLNISETSRDTQFHWNTNRDLHTPYSTVSFRVNMSSYNIQWHEASRGLWDRFIIPDKTHTSVALLNNISIFLARGFVKYIYIMTPLVAALITLYTYQSIYIRERLCPLFSGTHISGARWQGTRQWRHTPPISLCSEQPSANSGNSSCTSWPATDVSTVACCRNILRWGVIRAIFVTKTKTKIITIRFTRSRTSIFKR